MTDVVIVLKEGSTPRHVRIFAQSKLIDAVFGPRTEYTQVYGNTFCQDRRYVDVSSGRELHGRWFQGTWFTEELAQVGVSIDRWGHPCTYRDREALGRALELSFLRAEEIGGGVEIELEHEGHVDLRDLAAIYRDKVTRLLEVVVGEGEYNVQVTVGEPPIDFYRTDYFESEITIQRIRDELV